MVLWRCVKFCAIARRLRYLFLRFTTPIKPQSEASGVAGAHGYLSKSNASDDLLKVVKKPSRKPQRKNYGSGRESFLGTVLIALQADLIQYFLYLDVQCFMDRQPWQKSVSTKRSCFYRKRQVWNALGMRGIRICNFASWAISREPSHGGTRDKQDASHDRIRGSGNLGTDY